MKKCVYILLSITFLLNSSGYIILYLKLQHDIKKEMLHKISNLIGDEQLTKITFSKQSLTDWKTIDEIKYDGNMYDVVKKEDKGSYIVLYCLNDVKEEAVIKNFSKHFDDLKKPGSQKRHIQIFNFTAIVNKIYYLNRSNDLFGQIISDNNFYKSIKKETTSPPPKFSIS